jgi:sugar phosphate isomerase/epimerase
MCTWFVPALPDPGLFRRMAGERIKRAAGIAGDYGVRIGLEWVAPYTSRQGEGLRPFIWRMDQMLEWIDQMGEGNLGLLVDSWHWYHQEGTVAELEALAAEQIVHVHINDAPDRPRETLGDVTDRVFPGEGIINLAGFVGALAKVGYADYVSPEILNPAVQELPGDEAIARAVGGVRRLLGAG